MENSKEVLEQHKLKNFIIIRSVYSLIEAILAFTPDSKSKLAENDLRSVQMRSFIHGICEVQMK